MLVFSLVSFEEDLATILRIRESSSRFDSNKLEQTNKTESSPPSLLLCIVSYCTIDLLAKKGTYRYPVDGRSSPSGLLVETARDATRAAPDDLLASAIYPRREQRNSSGGPNDAGKGGKGRHGKTRGGMMRTMVVGSKLQEDRRSSIRSII